MRGDVADDNGRQRKSPHGKHIVAPLPNRGACTVGHGRQEGGGGCEKERERAYKETMPIRIENWAAATDTLLFKEGNAHAKKRGAKSQSKRAVSFQKYTFASAPGAWSFSVAQAPMC